MRHLKRGRKFGRERSQRGALLEGLASSFFMRGRIETTEAKAKELRPYVERCITRGKTGALDTRRHLGRFFHESITRKIMEIGGREKRAGGYTRITKSRIRMRDGARMAILELMK